MLTENFRTVARALQPYISNTYDLLNATDAVLAAQRGATTDPDTHNHDSLVAAALNDPEVMQAMVDTKKIPAIKRLRTLTNCGLKEAKEAVEDYRVTEAVGQRRHDEAIADLRERLTGNPWDEDTWRDEPPF